MSGQQQIPTFTAMQPTQKYLIVIAGPTASGKTALAIQLAQRLGCAILSADSRQFFAEMSIGTAKPSALELAQAEHHFVGHRSVAAPYSVGDYEREVAAFLASYFEAHDMAILVGGSGLYIKAVCEGLDEFPAVPAAVQAAVQQLYDTAGIEGLQAALAAEDPAYFQEVDRQNPARLLRALSVCRASGRPYSSFRSAAPQARPFTPIYLQVQVPRPLLYARIDRRVEAMMAAGLEAEARGLYPLRHLVALQTVGYQELFAYFDGAGDLAAAVSLIQQNSRRYAKRQLTWFRRDGHWKHIGGEEADVALAYIQEARQHGSHLSTTAASAVGDEQVLALRRGEVLLAELPYRVFHKFVLLAPLCRHEACTDEAAHLLLHEAALLPADKAAYAITSPAGAAVYEAQGFVLVAGTLSLPAIVEKSLMPGQLLYEKPAAQAT